VVGRELLDGDVDLDDPVDTVDTRVRSGGNLKAAAETLFR
jgi:hypothetical protein